jgi:hypothetical protein
MFCSSEICDSAMCPASIKPTFLPSTCIAKPTDQSVSYLILLISDSHLPCGVSPDAAQTKLGLTPTSNPLLGLCLSAGRRSVGCELSGLLPRQSCRFSLVAWFSRRAALQSCIGTQPQRDVRRLHRLPYHPNQIITQCVQVRLVPQLGREGF